MKQFNKWILGVALAVMLTATALAIFTPLASAFPCAINLRSA